MPEATLDFWPSDITQPPDELPPVAFLRQQAQLLGVKTGNAVYARVRSYTTGGEFHHSFELNVPVIGFSHELFSVRHGVKPYPATFRYPGVFDSMVGGEKTVLNEDEFQTALRAALTAPETVRIVRNLVAQATTGVA